MSRPGQFGPEPGGGLPDRIAVGLLTGSFPPELVERVVARCGREGQRNRLLTPKVTVYLVLAMCLFPGHGYQEVARKLVRGLAWAGRCTAPGQVPSTAAISRARVKLGAEPFRELFAEVVRSAAVEEAGRAGQVGQAGQVGGVPYRGRRLVAVEGAAIEVPDSAENVAYFGPPEPGGGYPRVRLAALVECGTGAVAAAATGPSAAAVPNLARGLFDRLGGGDLLLADQGGFDAPAVWRDASAGGADLLWRVGPDAVLPVRQLLGDGSFLSGFAADGGGRGGGGSGRSTGSVAAPVVRVVEDPSAGESGRLLTTILDPGRAPAAELAALHGAWRSGARALRDLAADQLEAVRVLRSRSPEGVEQEVWGHLLVHHALRRLRVSGPGR
ncbi:transposase domain-containing protein [Kitasatospora sp. NPDC127067]|uniref:transposase domain-containing protein n=1 Tax=Kitasatospora sp. NPDC127067 TaxID=3347126 RepID=UPI0036541A55